MEKCGWTLRHHDYIHKLTATDGLLYHFTVIAEIKFKYNPVGSM